MKKDDVKIGSNYLAKVSDKVVSVRIDAENRSGGWDATNLATGKKIRIKSAQRLRGPAGKKGRGKQTTETTAVADAPVTEAAAVVESSLATDSTPKPKKAKEAKSDKPKRISAIDAAAQVLRETKAPMRCKEMIAAIMDQGLWSSPNGKTPEATLASAIIREIRVKGGESRFRKSDRGLFVANG
jgi:hypothetical protein